MEYVKVSFLGIEQDVSDILVALLQDYGYEGFEEGTGTLHAFIDEKKFKPDTLNNIAQTTRATFKTERIAQQNWNALWESNFSPVVVNGFCTVKADFHEIDVITPYQVTITPKMSFGTGHHATTQLMMQLMQHLKISNKLILDFGTGTGVLAILAEKMGAGRVIAIDNDDWSVDNAKENIQRNDCTKITVLKGSLEMSGDYRADIILANINRHILLEYMRDMYVVLKKGGSLIMSGLLSDDEQVIRSAALTEGFVFNEMKLQDNWIALVFNKV